MKNSLVDLYRSIDENVRTVYVFPRIKNYSKHNPYLKVLYNDLILPSRENVGIKCTSPHPMLPVFILKRMFGEKSIVHYHWLEFSDPRGLLVLLWKLCSLLIYKLLGGNIVWTVHNQFPHRKNFLYLNRFFYRLMAIIAIKIHVHCNEAVDKMSSILKVDKDKFYIIGHPLFPVNIIDKKSARDYIRQKLCFDIDISKPIFLMYGSIGRYKGTIAAIQACKKNNCQLIIAGKVVKGEKSYLKGIELLIRNSKEIYLRPFFQTLEDEKYLFNAADCTIFNFREILSSGSVMLAISYRKDIIMPNIGCLKELSGKGIYKFNSQNELEQQLNKYINSFIPGSI